MNISNVARRVKLFPDKRAAEKSLETLVRTLKVVHYERADGESGYSIMADGNKLYRQNGEIC